MKPFLGKSHDHDGAFLQGLLILGAEPLLPVSGDGFGWAGCQPGHMADCEIEIAALVDLLADHGGDRSEGVDPFFGLTFDFFACVDLGDPRLDGAERSGIETCQSLQRDTV